MKISDILQKYGYKFPYTFSASYGHSLSSSLSYIVYGSNDHEDDIYKFIIESYYALPLNQLSKEQKDIKDKLNMEDRRNPIIEMQLFIEWLNIIKNKRSIVLFSIDKEQNITSEVFINDDVNKISQNDWHVFAFNNNPIVLVFDFNGYRYFPAFSLGSQFPIDFQYLQSNQPVNPLSTGAIYGVSIIFFILVYYVLDSQKS